MLAWSPNGKTLAAACEDKKAYGHFRGSPDVEQEFVYVVLTDAGQETLTPAEFEQRFGWQNDPSKVPHLPGMEP